MKIMKFLQGTFPSLHQGTTPSHLSRSNLCCSKNQGLLLPRAKEASLLGLRLSWQQYFKNALFGNSFAMTGSIDNKLFELRAREAPDKLLDLHFATQFAKPFIKHTPCVWQSRNFQRRSLCFFKIMLLLLNFSRCFRYFSIFSLNLHFL